LAGDANLGAPQKAPPRLRSLIQDPKESAEPSGEAVTRRLFKIRGADASGQRSPARIQISRTYASRGQRDTWSPQQELPTHITLVATEKRATIGLMTLAFDSVAGLRVEDPFALEVRALRDAGLRICEFTQLAMDSVDRFGRALASLFHVACIYAHRMMGFDDLLIEVSPRHAAYFETLLGFRMLGRERLNRHIDAPVVLLCLDFSFAQEQAALFGGMPELASIRRSLYPCFFSVAEEASIVGRLKQTQPDVLYSHAPSGPTGIFDA
jgi:hypothetical protein